MTIRSNISPIVPLTPTPVKIDQPETFGTSALAPDPMPIEGTIEPLELVKIDPKNRLEVFTTPGGLQPYLDAVAAKARSFIPDVTTRKGRENIISLAFSIAKVKVALEKEGVDLNRELKEKPALVDKNKKAAKEFLEALQSEIRQPVTNIEAEEARIEAERVAAEAAAALVREIEADHEIALTLNWAFDQRKKQEAEELERMVAEREAEIAREAAEDERKAAAQREADAVAAVAKAEQDKAEAIRREQEAEARAEQAKKDAEAARIKAEKDAAELAERNRLAAIKAKEDADARTEAAAKLAREQEQQRQATAAKKEADELAARERDLNHKKAFNAESLADLMKATGIAEQDARNVLNAIYKKLVRHIVINY